MKPPFTKRTIEKVNCKNDTVEKRIIDQMKEEEVTCHMSLNEQGIKKV